MTESPSRDVPRSARRRLIEAAQHGDHSAQQELVRRYEPLVRRVVWKLRLPPGCEREDLAQEARIGLLAAIRAWRPERGPFSAFADRCVTNQALLAVKAAGTRKQQLLSLALSLELPVFVEDDGSVLTLRDTLAAPRNPRSDPEARVLVREQLASVLGALPTLTASERAALATSLNEQSYKHAAPVLGGTCKAASHAACRARRKLAASLPRAA